MEIRCDRYKSDAPEYRKIVSAKNYITRLKNSHTLTNMLSAFSLQAVRDLTHIWKRKSDQWGQFRV